MEVFEVRNLDIVYRRVIEGVDFDLFCEFVQVGHIFGVTYF